MSSIVIFGLIVSVVILAAYAFMDQSKIKRLRCQRNVLYESLYGVEYETRFSEKRIREEAGLENDRVRFRRQRDVLKSYIRDFLRYHAYDDLLLVLKEISEE
jgi:hypothetical protein